MDTTTTWVAVGIVSIVFAIVVLRQFRRCQRYMSDMLPDSCGRRTPATRQETPKTVLTALQSLIHPGPIDLAAFSEETDDAADIETLRIIIDELLKAAEAKAPPLDLMLVTIDSHSVRENLKRDSRYDIVFVVYERTLNVSTKLRATIIITRQASNRKMLVQDVQSWSTASSPATDPQGHIGRTPRFGEYRGIIA